MITPKTRDEIKIMQKAGEVAKVVKERLVKAAKVGVSTDELDQLAEKLIGAAGATPSFKGYRGFPKGIVTCLDSEVVHGIPSERKLAAGDLLTIDLGVFYQEFHMDTAETFEVGGWRLEVGEGGGEEDKKLKTEKKKFLGVGKEALNKAISQCIEGKRVGDISHAVQEIVEQAGYNVVRSYVGHGIGKNLHEEPQIPCFGEKGKGEVLKENMTLAVEVIYVQGLPQVKILEDGWTVVTKDGKLSALFEETVMVRRKKALVLT